MGLTYFIKMETKEILADKSDLYLHVKYSLIIL